MEESPEELRADSHTLIIDGLNNYIRAFTAVPAISDNGYHVGGLLGFLKTVIYSINRFNPTQVVIVFDGKGGSLRRKKLYKDYKEKRTPKITLNRFEDYGKAGTSEDAFRHQLSRAAEYLTTLPVRIIIQDHVEADDVIAYISRQCLNKPDQRITIVSSDKDFLQLVDERTSVFRPTKKIVYTPESLKEDFDVVGENFLIRRCFEGDNSDNINGVLRVGHKTLLKLFDKYGSDDIILIEEIEEECKKQVELKNRKKVYSAILEQVDILKRNFKLMQLQDVDISGTVKSNIRGILERPVKKFDQKTFIKLYKEDGLFSNLPDVQKWINTAIARLNIYAER